MNMESNCFVTNSRHEIEMTTICHWMNPNPHGNFLRTPLPVLVVRMKFSLIKNANRVSKGWKALPWWNKRRRFVKRVRPGCVRTPDTFSVGLKPETSMVLLVPSALQPFRPKSAFTSVCMEVTFKYRLLGLSLLALADFCLHVAVALAWLLHLVRTNIITTSRCRASSKEPKIFACWKPSSKEYSTKTEEQRILKSEC